MYPACTHKQVPTYVSTHETELKHTHKKASAFPKLELPLPKLPCLKQRPDFTKLRVSFILLSSLQGHLQPV